jgi:hypothetical protein
MNRLKSRTCSFGCIAAVIPILSILFMPQWSLANDDDIGRNAALYRMAADT